MGPTVIDEDTGKVTQEGWVTVNEQDGFREEIRLKTDPGTAGSRIETVIKEMPNELDPSEAQ